MMINDWLVVEPYPSEKYEFVSWDDDILNIWKNKKIFQSTNQIWLVYDESMDNIWIIISYTHITIIY